MTGVEQITELALANFTLIEALEEKRKMTSEQADNAKISLIADLYLQIIDIGIDELYDEEDPDFGRAVLANIYKGAEHRLKCYDRRYKKDENRFTVED